MLQQQKKIGVSRSRCIPRMSHYEYSNTNITQHSKESKDERVIDHRFGIVTSQTQLALSRGTAVLRSQKAVSVYLIK